MHQTAMCIDLDLCAAATQNLQCFRYSFALGLRLIRNDPNDTALFGLLQCSHDIRMRQAFKKCTRGLPKTGFNN